MMEQKQRLKGAIDRLAEEEDATRIAEQRTSRSLNANRTSNVTVSPSHNERSSLQVGIGKSTIDTADIIQTHYPNPSTSGQNAFEQKSDSSYDASTSNSSIEALMARDSARGDSVGQVPVITTDNSEPQESMIDSQETSAGSKPELPMEVRSKLRRLARLEGKYQELLRAYRQAHARNSSIEPFETKLREITPLTSIEDPQAFVEFLNQLSMKSEMVLDELKRVSSEKDSIKSKLENTEREIRKASDEVARLRTERSFETEQEGTKRETTANEISTVEEETDHLLQSMPEPAIASLKSEVAALRRELQLRDEHIEELETQSVAKSTESEPITQLKGRSSVDLNEVENRTEDFTAVTAISEMDSKNRYAGLERNISDLQDELRIARVDAERYKENCREHQNSSERLQNELISAREDLRSLRLHATSHKAPNVDLNGDSCEKSFDSSTLKSDDATNSTTKKRKNKKKKKASNSPLNIGIDDRVARVAIEGVSLPETIREGNERAQETKWALEMQNLNHRAQEQNLEISRLTRMLKDQADLEEEIETLRDELVLVGQEHVEAKDALKRIQAERDSLTVSVEDLQAQTKDLQVARMNGEIISRSDSKTEPPNDETVILLDTIKQLENQLGNSTLAMAEVENLRAEKKDLVQEKLHFEDQVSSLLEERRSRDEQSEIEQSTSKIRINELQIKISSLEVDLSAAQQLAASRFRDLAEIRERFQRLQPELMSLRSEVSELRSLKSDHAARASETRKLEASEADLRAEMSSLRKEILQREAEIKNLQQKSAEENDQRDAVEESHRKTQRMLQRSQRDKADILAAKEEGSKVLQQVQSDLIHYKKFEDQVLQLNRDIEGLRDDIALKSAQYASTQSLMSSLQDQTIEMATQNRESKERCETLEDELTEVCRQRDGRSREAETMRRLLAEVEGRADSRIKAMKERLENANEERDRAEDEASTIGRRRAKEVEELKSRLRDAERDLEIAKESKTELDDLRKELHDSGQAGAHKQLEITQELAVTKESLKSLQDILQDGEIKIKELETEKIDLKRNLEEARLRLEKQQKSNKSLVEDLRSLRGMKPRSSDSPFQSSRSSLDASSQISRAMSPPGNDMNSKKPSSSISSAAVGGGSSVDYVYLKQILLQFVEQKDRKLQLQLIPVLGMLLQFDKKEEQKWSAAISAK